MNEQKLRELVAKWRKRDLTISDQCADELELWLSDTAEPLVADLERIRAVACGEEQVETYEGEPLLEGDTGGMQWIYKFADAALQRFRERSKGCLDTHHSMGGRCWTCGEVVDTAPATSGEE